MLKINDLIIRIKNAYMKAKKKIEVVNTKLMDAFSDCLQRLGYIKRYCRQGMLYIKLLYDEYGDPLIKTFKHISKSSRLCYMTLKDIRNLTHSGGQYIVSTNKGWLGSKECENQGVGGMVSCYLGLV